LNFSVLGSRRLNENRNHRNLPDGGQRRHDIDRVGISCSRHGGHFDGLVIVGRHLWRRRRRYNAEWVVGACRIRRRSNRGGVPANNSSGSLVTTTAATLAEDGAADRDDYNDDDEENDAGNKGDNEGNEIENNLKLVKVAVKVPLGSGIGTLSASETRIALLANTDIRKL